MGATVCGTGEAGKVNCGEAVTGGGGKDVEVSVGMGLTNGLFLGVTGMTCCWRPRLMPEGVTTELVRGVTAAETGLWVTLPLLVLCRTGSTGSVGRRGSSLIGVGGGVFGLDTTGSNLLGF